MREGSAEALRRVEVEGVARLPGWMHATVAGDFVYVAGMLGSTGDGFEVVPGGIAPETTQALRNIERILRECDTSLGGLVKVTVYLTNMADFGAMEAAYGAILGPDGPPRTTVKVSRLGVDAAIEIDCIAYRPQQAFRTEEAT